jgi:uncharacterized protein YciI
VTYFAVIREAGTAWTDGLGAFEQPGVNDHATFMNALTEDGFVLFAGPVDGTEAGRIRALLIVQATDDAEIRDRLAGDPWSVSGHLDIASVQSWNVIVGEARLTTSSAG